MAFTLPELPYAKDALAPHISAETLDFHHGKHHQAYVTKLNELVAADAGLAGKSLEDLVRTTSGGVFNQAAQVWNHTFYWHSMRPGGGGEPTGAVGDAINKAFGNFSSFKEKFTAAAIGQFGSGWAWVVYQGGKLSVTSTPNQDNPLMDGSGYPVFGVDVWEHAYYLKYQNRRPEYLNNWWNVVNWNAVADRYAKVGGR